MDDAAITAANLLCFYLKCASIERNNSLFVNDFTKEIERYRSVFGSLVFYMLNEIDGEHSIRYTTDPSQPLADWRVIKESQHCDLIEDGCSHVPGFVPPTEIW